MPRGRFGRGRSLPSRLGACRRNPGQSDEKGPAARRRPTAAREAYSPYVPLGGGLRPPSETSPQVSLRRQSRRSEVEHSHVGGRAQDRESHGTPLNVPVRAAALPAQSIPGGGLGGGRRGPLRIEGRAYRSSVLGCGPERAIEPEHTRERRRGAVRAAALPAQAFPGGGLGGGRRGPLR